MKSMKWLVAFLVLATAGAQAQAGRGLNELKQFLQLTDAQVQSLAEAHRATAATIQPLAQEAAQAAKTLHDQVQAGADATTVGTSLLRLTAMRNHIQELWSVASESLARCFQVTPRAALSCAFS